MYIADLHIHSKYSRATSKDCVPEHLDFWAKRKGIQLIGTGDFTHPAWREELKEKLIPAEQGLYQFPRYFKWIKSAAAQSCYYQGTFGSGHRGTRDGKDQNFDFPYRLFGRTL